MIVLLWALTIFNIVAGLAGIGLVMRLTKRDERALWRSKTLLAIADAFAWVLPLAAAIGTALAWVHVNAGEERAALFAFIPIGWLVLMGIVFALVDYAEDGILGNGRMRN